MWERKIAFMHGRASLSVLFVCLLLLLTVHTICCWWPLNHTYYYCIGEKKGSVRVFLYGYIKVSIHREEKPFFDKCIRERERGKATFFRSFSHLMRAVLPPGEPITRKTSSIWKSFENQMEDLFA